MHKTLDIVAIVGSLRRDSFTRRLVRSFDRVLPATVGGRGSNMGVCGNRCHKPSIRQTSNRTSRLAATEFVIWVETPASINPHL